MSDQAVIPETAIPETVAPETVAPETVIPEVAVPDTALPETSSAPGSDGDNASSRDVVAGLLAGAAVVIAAIGAGAGLVLEIGGHPGKLIPIAALLAIVTAVMSKRFQPMAFKALIFVSIAWVVGMTIAVITDAPLF